MRDSEGLVAEEPLKGYLAMKIPSIMVSVLILALDGWFFYISLQGQIAFEVTLGVLLVTLPVLVGLFAIGPLIRRQRARLFRTHFAPTYKTVSYFLRGRPYLVPLEAVETTEYQHGKTQLRVVTHDGKSFSFWVGNVGSDFYTRLSDYFEERVV